MAVWAEVRRSQFEKGVIGSEYYAPQYLALGERLKKCMLRIEYLSTCCSLISDGDHSKTQYEESGVRFLLSECVQEMRVQPEIGRFISKHLHERLTRTQLQPGDVLLTKTGAYFGKAAIVPMTLNEANTSAHVARLVPRPYLAAEWLALFLNCRYGQFQLRRREIKGTRPEMKLVETQDILVPIPPSEIQREVRNLVCDLERAWQRAEDVYSQAHQILKSELGLEEKEFAYDKGYETRLSQIFHARRWDAQCFHPGFLRYANAVRAYGNYERLDRLILPLVKGIQQDDAENGDIPYASIKHVNDFEMVTDMFASSAIAGLRVAEPNDLLLAITGATIGKVGIVGRYDRLAFSGDLLRIRVRDDIDPYYLLVMLRSPIGQGQLLRWVTDPQTDTLLLVM
jgi:type I restriction enzyme S subunit